jgi:hypothetical protein
MRRDTGTTAHEDGNRPEPPQLGSGVAVLVHAPNLPAIFDDGVIELAGPDTQVKRGPLDVG